MSSDAYNTANYHVKYPLQQQQHHYTQQNSYINPNNQQQQQFHQPNVVQQQQQHHQTYQNIQQQQQPLMVQHNVVASNQQNTSTNVYLSLLGIADSLQKSHQYLLSIHCLESILTLKNQDISIVTNFHIQLKTRLRLCRIYLRHTVNTNQYVNAHLEKSMILVKNVSNVCNKSTGKRFSNLSSFLSHKCVNNLVVPIYIFK